MLEVIKIDCETQCNMRIGLFITFSYIKKKYQEIFI